MLSSGFIEPLVAIEKGGSQYRLSLSTDCDTRCPYANVTFTSCDGLFDKWYKHSILVPGSEVDIQVKCSGIGWFMSKI